MSKKCRRIEIGVPFFRFRGGRPSVQAWGVGCIDFKWSVRLMDLKLRAAHGRLYILGWFRDEGLPQFCQQEYPEWVSGLRFRVQGLGLTGT